MRTVTEVTSIEVAPGKRQATVRSSGGVFRGLITAREAGYARVNLLPQRALLLAGDHIHLQVFVRAGATVDLVETAGTVAYDMRGGSASWSVELTVEAGGHLRFHTLPWVSAEGSNVRRRTELDLHADATALLREKMVLGRVGEVPGELATVTRFSRDCQPVLYEDVHAGVLAPHTVSDAIYALGYPQAPALGGGEPFSRFALASGDWVYRSLSDQAHTAAIGIDRVWGGLASSAFATTPLRKRG